MAYREARVPDTGAAAPCVGRRAIASPRALSLLFVWLPVLFCLLLAVSGTPAAWAASNSPVPAIPSLPGTTDKAPKPPTDAAKVPEFVSKLDDRQAREVLLESLQARPASSQPNDRESLGEVFGEASTQLQDAGARLASLAGAFTQFGQAPTLFVEHLHLDEGGAAWFMLKLAGVGALGLAAEFALIAALARLLAPSRSAMRARVTAVAIRMAGFAAFTCVLAVAAVLLSKNLPEQQQRFLIRLAIAFWAVRAADLTAQASIASLIGRRRFALHGPPHYPMAFSTAHATIAFGGVLLGVLREAGVDHDVRLLIGLGLWTLLCGAAVHGLGRVDRLLTPLTPSAAPSPSTQRSPSAQSSPSTQDETADKSAKAMEDEAIEIAPGHWLYDNWYGIALAIVAFIWLATVLVAVGAGLRALRAGALTVLLVGYAPALMNAVTLLLRRSLSEKSSGLSRNRVWATALVRCTRIVVLIVLGLVLADIWDIDPVGIASNRFGEGAVKAAVDVFLVVLVAYVAWEIVKALVRGNAASQERAEIEASDEIGFVQPASRMQTFLPLVEKFLLAVVIIVAALAIMKALGVDTAPLLAGAGIAGIAIGFGAQTLVRDIVSGIFFLLDDAFRLGEYVEIDQTRGTVEGISIRSLRIRHHRGAIHTVPFGTIQRLTNYSRDWIILKLEFLVDFDTDLQKVKKIVKAIGQEMLEDPEYGQHFLEPAKSQGVRRMEQIGMVIGVKFTAKPGEQFILRREVYQRVRDAFEKNGIKFARPQVVVQVPGGGATGLPPEAEDAVAAAAAEAAQPEPPPAEPGRKPARRRLGAQS
jgi:small-conductance mechanosensitive channel